MESFEKILVREENFREIMRGEVEPFLESVRTSGSFERTPGRKLYYDRYLIPDARRTVVVLHGFLESAAKFREMAWYFLKTGSNVFLLEQADHGRSFRESRVPYRSLISSYDGLILDLDHFVRNIVQQDEAAKGLPLYLYGHSMGGAVSALYLERFSGVFEKAVLSSPMLGMLSGNIPYGIAYAATRCMVAVGAGGSGMNMMPEFKDEPDFKASFDTSRERYLYYHDYVLAHPECRTWQPAWKTVLEFHGLTRECLRPENCKALSTKVLLMQAGNDTVVDNAAQEIFLSRIPDGEKAVFPEAKHEIYMSGDETMKRYVPAVLSFFVD